MTILMNGINGGSGSSGTTNYNALSNKPQINGVTLQGNKTTADLNIAVANYTFSGLGLTTTGISSKAFIQALAAKDLPSGSIVVGGVNFTDFPTDNVYNAELTVVIKDSLLTDVKVYNMTLSSLTTAPYIWNAAYRTDSTSSDIAWVSGPVEFTTMPTATATFLDMIVHFVGVTTSDYTQGYFYKCIYDTTASTPGYAWKQINVQPNLDVTLIAGYDSTKTQTLRHVNGTLTWVTE